ncbi:unnamed protein product [Trichogramma brassicae]|uniref:Uncharacterized protein n=1 Tax=Trichogramma brassicae TaxID=86971 RepID=A0A6H5HXG1_9HYME|nr:unnamed protein product [Trichogramma brassicae]
MFSRTRCDRRMPRSEGTPVGLGARAGASRRLSGDDLLVRAGTQDQGPQGAHLHRERLESTRAHLRTNRNEKQRYQSFGIGQARIGASYQQRFDHLRVSARNSQVQRCVAFIVPGIDLHRIPELVDEVEE